MRAAAVRRTALPGPSSEEPGQAWEAAPPEATAAAAERRRIWAVCLGEAEAAYDQSAADLAPGADANAAEPLATDAPPDPGEVVAGDDSRQPAAHFELPPFSVE